jgi:hypothetical protein
LRSAIGGDTPPIAGSSIVDFNGHS